MIYNIKHNSGRLTTKELKYHLKGCALNDLRSQNVIYNYLYSYGIIISGRYTNTREDAIEIVHDGLIKIFRELHHFQPAYCNVVTSFKGWAKSIIIYTAIDHFRKNQKHRILISHDNEMFRHLPMYDRAEEKLTQKEIIHALKEISPGYQDVLKLFAVSGLGHREIAKQLNISVGTSKSNLSKARKQLQKIIIQQNL